MSNGDQCSEEFFKQRYKKLQDFFNSEEYDESKNKNGSHKPPQLYAHIKASGKSSEQRLKLVELDRPSRDTLSRELIKTARSRFKEDAEIECSFTNDIAAGAIFAVRQDENFCPCCITQNCEQEHFCIDDLERIIGFLFAIRLGQEDSNDAFQVQAIALYQKVYNFSLQKKRGVLSFLKRDELFKVSCEDFFVLETNRVDYAIVGDALFCHNANDVKKTEEYQEMLCGKALKQYDNAMSNLFSEKIVAESDSNREKIAELVAENSRYRSYLADAGKSWIYDEEYKGKVHKAIQDAIENGFYDNGLEWGGNGIVITSSEGAKNFINLLDDAYLGSPLTKREYWSHNKQQAGAR